MKSSYQGDAILKYLLWTARTGSIISIFFLLMIFVGEWELPVELSARDAVMITFFPGGVVLGMIIAWFKERRGALITVYSLALFYLADLAFSGNIPRGPYFILFSLPGFLFLFHDMKS